MIPWKKLLQPCEDASDDGLKTIYSNSNSIQLKIWELEKICTISIKVPEMMAWQLCISRNTSPISVKAPGIMAWKPCIHLQRWSLKIAASPLWMKRWWFEKVNTSRHNLENQEFISRDDTLKRAVPSLKRCRRWWFETIYSFPYTWSWKMLQHFCKGQRWVLKNHVSISRDDTLNNYVSILRDGSLKTAASSL